MMKIEDIEEDAKEIAAQMPHAKTIQLLSANPLALSYENLGPRLEAIRRHLPELEVMYTATRVSDLKSKSVEELKKLRELGIREISFGVESGDDWTLARIHKSYHASDILEQCKKLEEAEIDYWVTFLNGVAGNLFYVFLFHEFFKSLSNPQFCPFCHKSIIADYLMIFLFSLRQ